MGFISVRWGGTECAVPSVVHLEADTQRHRYPRGWFIVLFDQTTLIGRGEVFKFVREKCEHGGMSECAENLVLGRYSKWGKLGALLADYDEGREVEWMSVVGETSAASIAE